MKRHIYEKKVFTKTTIPDYECPRCGAHLELKNSGEYDSAKTIASRSFNECHDFYDEDGVFHFQLKCTRDKCQESIVVLGKTSVEEEHEESVNGWERNFVSNYLPQYFVPHLKIFEIPPNTPESVSESIDASFNLFFVSSGSALNEIRNAVEFLMDELGVPRKGMNDEVPPVEVRWDLDTRVGKMPNQSGANVKSQLLAIKNLGNWGSHAVQTTRADVLTAYELLHYVLDELYLKRGDAVKALTKQVKDDERGK